MQIEKEFLARLRNREESAFAELYRNAGTRLYNYILCRVGRDGEAAGDVLSEVFLDVVKYTGTLTPFHNLDAWLFRICKSKIANHYRRLSREVKWKSSAPLETVSDEKSTGEDPVLQHIRQEEKAFVMEAFTSLPAEYQEIMQKKYVLEHSVREISTETGRSEKSVESILYRGRKQLEQSLKNLKKKHDGDMRV